MVLAHFRRTRSQVIGHRLYLGTLCGAGVAVMAGVPLVARVVDGWQLPARVWLGWLLVSLVPVGMGLIAGLLGGAGTGADVDDLGVHRVPEQPRAFGPWPAIMDIRAERRAGRIAVALYLESGLILRLRAPYDGRLLAHDPEFERKYFTLRNLWENHRRWH